jgi:DNA-binding PadR family transcriptional regulator
VKYQQLMSETQTATDQDIGYNLTEFQYNILTILSDEAMYGLAVKRQLEAYYGSEVNHGRLYPNLDELAELGLVEKSELDKRTNQYALSDTGYEVLLDKIDWLLSKFVADDDRSETVRDLVVSQQWE